MSTTKKRTLSNEVLTDILVKSVQENFRTFGGGKQSAWGNPITAALAESPPSFAAGVSVEDVVKHILSRLGI